MSFPLYCHNFDKQSLTSKNRFVDLLRLIYIKLKNTTVIDFYV